MGKQSGYTWISPYIILNDVAAGIQFYEKAFGFHKKNAMPGPDGTIIHAELTYQGQTLMFGKANAFDMKAIPPVNNNITCPITLYAYCENVDRFYQDAIAAGAKSLTAPEDTFWGDRMCSLQDPDGYVWNFATHTGVMDVAKAQV